MLGLASGATKRSTKSDSAVGSAHAQKSYTLEFRASLSEPHLGPYSGCGLCHMVIIYRTSCPMRMRGVYVESSKVSRGKRVAQGGIVALLNRLNIERWVQCDEELRIEYGTL